MLLWPFASFLNLKPLLYYFIPIILQYKLFELTQNIYSLNQVRRFRILTIWGSRVGCTDHARIKIHSIAQLHSSNTSQGNRVLIFTLPHAAPAILLLFSAILLFPSIHDNKVRAHFFHLAFFPLYPRQTRPCHHSLLPPPLSLPPIFSPSLQFPTNKSPCPTRHHKIHFSRRRIDLIKALSIDENPISQSLPPQNPRRLWSSSSNQVTTGSYPSSRLVSGQSFPPSNPSYPRKGRRILTP